MSVEAIHPRAVRHPDDGWVMADPFPMPRVVRRALDGLARAMCPPPPAPQLAELEERVAMQTRRMLRYMPPIVAIGFCVAVLLLDWSPLWRFAAWRRVQSLPRARGAEILEAIGWSKIPGVRLLVLGVRGLILSVYFDQDEVHRAMGYAPAPFIEQRVTLRRKLIAEARAASNAPPAPPVSGVTVTGAAAAKPARAGGAR